MQRLQLLLWLCTTLSLNSIQGQCIQGDCHNGLGTFKFPSGSQYQGQFKNWVATGHGTFYFTDGRKYIGDFSQSYFDGIGKYFMSEGEVFEGEFVKGKRSGVGILTMANEDVYVGEWKEDVLHGAVKFASHEGWSFSGIWQNGVPTNIPGRCIDKKESLSISYRECVRLKKSKDSLRFPGEIDKESSSESYTYRDGSIWYGPLVDGIPQGNGLCVFPDGREYRGDWMKDHPQGLGAITYPDATVRYGRWDNGLLKERINPPTSRVEELIESKKGKGIRVWVVLVGIAHYDALPSLKYSNDDAYLMYAFYKSPEGGALPDKQISLLIDEGGSRMNIMNALREKATQADSNDVLVFFFSGHGLKESLVAQDFNGYKNLIEHQEIAQIMEGSAARQKLCYIDACYAGSLTATRAGVDRTLNLFYDAFGELDPGIALILSSKSTEVSLENSGLRHGVFSHYLIKGLKGKADSNKDRIVNVNELFAYIHKGVTRYTRGRQTPVITGNYDGNMPVGVVRQ